MISEYTPTTDAVRESYALSGSRLTGRRLAAFDRWLAAHDAQVKAEALEEAAGIVSSVERAIVDRGRGTLVAKLDAMGALDSRAAEYRSGARA